MNQQWGLAGDIPVPGDFDGDGKADFAVWRPSDATWYIIPSSQPSNIREEAFGAMQDVILGGEFSGNLYAVAWHPDSGEWSMPSGQFYLLNPISSQQWGLPGDIPLLGDFDGDGQVDFTVWRPSNGTWYIIPSSNPSSPIIKQWGLPGDIPLIADFDGDGISDFTVWRPSNGTWYVIPSSRPSSIIVKQWGLPGDTPVSGSFSGYINTDFTVWRPSNGTWYIHSVDETSAPTITQWGLPGDIPIAASLPSLRSYPSVWRPSTAEWYFDTYVPINYTPVSFGVAGDQPLVFHHTTRGNGGTDYFAIYRPSAGVLETMSQVACPYSPCNINGSIPNQLQIGTPLDVPF